MWDSIWICCFDNENAFLVLKFELDIEEEFKELDSKIFYERLVDSLGSITLTETLRP